MSWNVASTGKGSNLSYSQAGTPSLDLRFAETKTLRDYVSSKDLITFTRASSGTYVDSAGVLRTAANDEPRFDHNPSTGECLGLLVEEQRTNLLVRSEEFGTTWSQLNSTVSANTSTSPAGNSTADIITPAASTSAHLVAQAVTVQASTQYIASVYVKSDGAPFVQVVYDNGNSIGAFLNINTSTGAITRGPELAGGASNVVGGVVPVSNGWYRLFIGATHTGTIGRILVSTLPAGAGTTSINATSTTTTTDRIAIWGAQLEAGAFPTSYIPTTTSAATRAADVASISGSNFSSWYRQDEGTVFVDAASIYNGGRYFMFDNGPTTTERWEGRYSSFLATGNSWSNSVQDVALNTGITGGTPSTNVRVAIANASNNAAIASSGEGATIGTDTSSTMPASQSRLWIGSFKGTATFANGPIRRLCFWPARLPNATLQALTL